MGIASNGRESSATDKFKKREQSEFLKLLKAEGQKTILEIGCGRGRDTQFFQTQGFQALAVDNAPTMVK
ncbi:MAG: class I SAM-dependent methyltransferase, partial [Candidatus Poribacteria bacterium]|nr:class I SAM-dependent methyltransferase [Candidatus Poribacteria bacterium]